jgi:hypothetical protein
VWLEFHGDGKVMLTTGILNGHKVLWLENDWLKVAVLPDKGADIPLIYHRPSGVQFLLQTPQGLQPPGEHPPVDFLENYEGGWQELFPNCGDACQVQGVILPMHGEVAILPWHVDILGDYEVRMWVNCRQSPFRVERSMRLQAGSVQVAGRITNMGAQAWPYVWGQHLVLGGDFLEEGCRLEIPATHIATPAEQLEPATSRLADAQWQAWPLAIGRQPGQRFDLQHIPGPQVHSHDDAFLTGFSDGHLAVTNPRLGLRFSLGWDAAVFPWLTMWMPYGGAELPPLAGIYGLGIEPWLYRDNLGNAISVGKARMLAPGESINTSLAITIEKTRD